MNKNRVACFVNLLKIGMSTAFARAIAKHMPETSAPTLREVPPVRKSMTISDGYTVNRFYS